MEREGKTAVPVALTHCGDYEPASVAPAVARLFGSLGIRPSRGTRVLVKPNLLAPRFPDFLPCTHPQVIREVCACLLDCGATVTVGDSPSMGTGIAMAEKTGLRTLLRGMPVSVIDLDRPVALRLPSSGRRIGISRHVLESELFLNVPKLKAHRMACVTGAVKNVFGCVVGVRKAAAHVRFGKDDRCFTGMILDLLACLPPLCSVLDGVVAMHETGPVHGRPYPLALLGGSGSAVALDTAIYGLLGLRPEGVPLWRAIRERGLPGGWPEDLIYPLESPCAFDAAGFKAPGSLQSFGFHPLRLVRHFLRRLKVAGEGRRAGGQ